MHGAIQLVFYELSVFWNLFHKLLGEQNRSRIRVKSKTFLNIESKELLITKLIPTNIYLLKVKNRNAIKRCETSFWFFIVNFEHILLFFMFILLTLNKYVSARMLRIIIATFSQLFTITIVFKLSFS